MTINRWYVRCADCLSTVCTDHYFQEATCTLCGGVVYTLGQVTPDGRVRATSRVPACDGRCTHATGPTCNCRCGGINHGTGLLVPVTYDAGSVRVSIPAQEVALQRAREWRAAIEQVHDEIETLLARKRAGEYLPAQDFCRLRRLQEAWRKAHEYASHQRRIEYIRKAMRDLPEEV